MTQSRKLSVGYRSSITDTELEIGWNGSKFASELPRSFEQSDDPSGDWWKSYITGSELRFRGESSKKVGLIDLFSGSGGLSQGVKLACATLGIDLSIELAVDVDEQALKTYARNHHPKRIIHDSVKNLVSYSVIRTPSGFEFGIRPSLVDGGVLDVNDFPRIVIGGPPCQGHSSFNNHTRHNDIRNELYMTVPAVAIAIGAEMVLIENVPRVGMSRENVVGASVQLLKDAGYNVEVGVLAADALGWPQTRKRFFIAAMKNGFPIPMETVTSALSHETRDLRWLIGDIETYDDGTLMTSVPVLSEMNQERVRALHSISSEAQGAQRYRLSDELRPMAHKASPTYKDVYGKLLWDGPAQTLTTGFLTPGRGRYVHPSQFRTLNPLEAARIQGFPDSYSFIGDDAAPSRALLSKWIGDAVPSTLGFAASLSLLLPFACNA